ncbi:MAG TPA: DUF1080 domain-containing protein [Methylomirabilota bacterium]|nr:DUF1080 domain-containing protein [Methylomirabilota bacterium]
MMLSAIFSLTPVTCALAMALGLGVVGAADKAAPAAPANKPATNAAPAPGSLFDGKTLTGWISTDFAGRGSVTVSNGQINLGMGYMTGITLTNTNNLPRMNYELSLDAMRVDGSDFFCGLTFPVGKEPCSFVVGGWGGGVVGLSSIDSEDASQNETTSYLNFVNGRWYHLRLRVEPKRIQAWIDGDRVVNFETEDKRLSIRLEMESSVPLGIATWNTAAALKNIQIKKL